MGTVRVVAQTVEGVLHLFKYPLTNQIAAPISAHSIIQFTADASGKVSSSLDTCIVMLPQIKHCVHLLSVVWNV